MKTTIILLILSFCLFSCYNRFEKGPFVCKSRIIYKHHEDETTKVTYHYGYSFMKGDFCYHLGPENFPEKNIVSYIFLEETITKDSKDLFNCDSIKIYYSKVFRVTEKDTLFLGNRINSIVKL